MDPGRWTPWTWLGYAYGLCVAGVLSYFLLGIPIQLTDSFGNLLNLQGRTLGQVLYDNVWQAAFLRPLLWGEMKVVYDLANLAPVAGAQAPALHAMFRGLHALQVTALIGLFVMLVRPRTARDVACLPLGLAVLVGVHTFAGTVEEAFPINTFLTIVLCCFGAALLALADYRWWHDAAAALLLACAALTVESGLLVWVIIVGAFLLGARGVSKVGVSLQVAMLVGYFLLRYGVLHVGAPSLAERSSGFGFGVLETAQLQERFGANPWPFYLYNVASSTLSVLFSEPRAGTWRLTGGLVGGEPEPAMLVNVMSSLLATGLLGWFAWSRRDAWRTGDLTRDDRLLLLFVAVLAANSLISYAYTKDVIMSPAGAFYALAVFVAARHAADHFTIRSASVRAATLGAAAVLSTGWAVRDVGEHAALRRAAVVVRNEWAYADEWIAEQQIDVSSPAAAALEQQLFDDAVWRHPAPPPMLPDQDWISVFDLE